MMRTRNLTNRNKYGAILEVANHHKKNVLKVLFSVTALSLLSMSILTMTMTANAQPYSSGSVSGTINSATSSTGGVTQMGICEVGAGGPCNNNVR